MGKILKRCILGTERQLKPGKVPKKMQFSSQVAAKNRESPEKDAIFRLRGS